MLLISSYQKHQRTQSIKRLVVGVFFIRSISALNPLIFLMVGFPNLPPLWGGWNCFLAIPGGAKYNPDSFRDGEIPLCPDNSIGTASRIVGFKKFFIAKKYIQRKP